VIKSLYTLFNANDVEGYAHDRACFITAMPYIQGKKEMSQYLLKLDLVATLLVSLLLFVSCLPNQSLHGKAKQTETRLLAVSDFISEVRAIRLHHDDEKLSEKIFTRALSGLKSNTEDQLRKTGRWKEDEDIVLHLEIEQIRLRKIAAVLLLDPFAGSDEMSVKVWITKAGTVIASGTISTSLGGGGFISTFPSSKRLDMLSQQIARKLVRARL